MYSLEDINTKWLKEKINQYHNGDRYEFAKAVHISRSLVEKIFSYRDIQDYHKDHFYKHFKYLEGRQSSSIDYEKTKKPKIKSKIEILASIQHEIWSHWMQYQFSICAENQNGDLVVPKEKVERWKRQIETNYSELSESEKQSDREQVLKFIHLI